MGNLVYNQDMGLLDLQEQARQGMNSMVKEIRGGLVSSYSSNSITLNTGIQYYRDTSTNQLKRNTTVLASDINALSFCWWHSDNTCTDSRDCSGSCSKSYLLQIDIGASKTVSRRTLSFSLSEKVELRNRI
jgi:hypothetical protein